MPTMWGIRFHFTVLEHGIETIECTDCDYREQQTDNNIKKSTQAEMIGLFKPE